MSQPVKTRTLANAKAMAQAAEEHASVMGMRFAVAILNQGSHTLHLIRGDDVSVGYVDLAINKACIAVAYGRATHELVPLSQPGQEPFGIQHSISGRAINFGGGMPINSEGCVIGAVGASAGTVGQDMAVARAAAFAWCAERITSTVVSTAATAEGAAA